MRKVCVTLRPDAVIGETDPRLFGAFVEHLGLTGALSLFALNRHLQEPMPVEVHLPGFGVPVLADALQLCDADLGAANTRDEPERVAPVPLREVRAQQDRVNLTLQPASWNLVRLTSA